MSDAAPSAPSGDSSQSSYVPVGDAPESAPAPYREVPQSEALDAAGIDDNQLMREAMEMARGKGEEKTAEEPQQTQAREEKVEAKDEPKQPSSQEYAQFYAKLQEVTERESKLKEREAPLAEFEAAKSSGDIEKALTLLGYQDPVQFLKDVAEYGGKPSRERSEISEMRKQFNEMKAKLEREETEKKAREEQAQRTQAITEKKSDIKKFIDSHPQFGKGLVALPNGVDEVFGVMQRHYQETKARTGRGEELPYAKAVEAVEKHWEGQLAEIAKNPKAREVFQKYVAGENAPVARASVAKAKAAEPAVAAKRPAQAPEDDYEAIRRGDKEMQEALAWLQKRDQARRA